MEKDADTHTRTEIAETNGQVGKRQDGLHERRSRKGKGGAEFAGARIGIDVR